MSFPAIDRFRLANYTFDREYYIVTTNVTLEGGWETAVFCNDPATDIKDFESLVELRYFDRQDLAKYIHSEMLYKWNTIEAGITNYTI